MQKIIIPILSISLLSSIIYANTIETNPEAIIEQENRQTILECVESLQSATGANDMKKILKQCESIQLRSITGTHGTGSSVLPPKGLTTAKIADSQEVKPEKKDTQSQSVGVKPTNAPIVEKNLIILHEKVCKKQINSPLCKDYELFERLYHITEERLPGKQFFPILLGITNAESSLGLDFAKDRVGGTCIGRNNWGGTKYQIHDDNTRTYSRELNGFLYGQKYSGRFVDQFGCNLYPFESVEEFFITKVNGMRYGYKGCIDSKTPIRCLSYKYVGNPDIAEESWIRNVSYFIY